MTFIKSIISVLLTFVVFSSFGTTIKFDFSTLDTKEHDIILYFSENEILKSNNIIRLNFKGGKTSFSKEIKTPQIFELEYAKERISVFVSPKYKTMKIVLSEGRLSYTRFEGIYGEDNKCFRDYERLYKYSKTKDNYSKANLTTILSKDIVSRAKAYDINSYFDYLNRKLNEQRTFYARYQLGSHFYRFLERDINCTYELHKLAYFLINETRYKHNELRGYWGRYAMMQLADMRDEAINHDTYQNLLTALVHYLYLETPIQVNNKSELPHHYYNFIDKNLEGRAKYFLQAQLLKETYQNGNSLLFEEKFRGYKVQNPYKEYTNFLGNISQYIQPKALTYAPNISLQLENGSLVQLSNYRGKVVYVSFWASWCAPCIKNFEKTAATRRELQRQGVVFLNISLDEKSANWKKTLQRRSIIGTNVLASDISKTQLDYLIGALPEYRVIDKQGFFTKLASYDLNKNKQELLFLSQN